MIILALDYKMTENPLTCTIDGRNVEALARECGVQDLTVLTDEQCTVENVKRTVEEVASRCDDDDMFIFYYSGHGTNLKDQSGDEADGQDEAFCFVDEQGQISYETCYTDDDFSDLLLDNLHPETRVLILTDCCHSGTIADLSKGDWASRHAISMTGCADNQTSGDIGKGGIFTHSMLMATQKLQQEGEEEYSVGRMYNETLERDEEVFDSAQDIAIQCSPGLSADQMVWPLIPERPYQAPLAKQF
jgi:hypothetical protein